MSCCGEPDRSANGAGVLIMSNIALIAHQAQNKVAALTGALRITRWIVIAGPLDHAGQQCRLIQAELPNVFAEEIARRFAKSIDTESAATPEVHLVAINFEN